MMPCNALCAALLVSLTVLSAFSALAQDPTATRRVEGAVTFRAPTPLPPQALAIVEARGSADDLLAEARVPGEGRQVPIPFALELPAAMPATLRAAVVVGGATRWLGAPVEIAAGTEPVALGVLVLAPFEPLAFDGTLRCGERKVRVGFIGQQAILEVDGERVALDPVRTASGARFEAAGDPGTHFWSKGNHALVGWRGTDLPECLAAVTEPDGPFRARGIEPGWSLEIAGGRITLVTDYGAERREARRPEPRFEDGALVFEMVEIESTVRVDQEICRDAATGMPHPSTVSVETGGAELSGCGGEPVELLLGPERVVEKIAGGGIVDRSRPTLEFHADGRVSGRGGCNVYHVGFTLTGEKLSFGQAASTMMACDESLMAQERQFFGALSEVARFDIDQTGALLLQAADGRTLILARREPG